MLTWTSQDGRDTADLGTLLLTFLMRYGRSFDYDQHAVSVGQGGVISRADLADPIPAGHIVQLIVEDVDTKRYAMAVTLLVHICHGCKISVDAVHCQSCRSSGLTTQRAYLKVTLKVPSYIG